MLFYCSIDSKNSMIEWYRSTDCKQIYGAQVSIVVEVTRKRRHGHPVVQFKLIYIMYPPVDNQY